MHVRSNPFLRQAAICATALGLTLPATAAVMISQAYGGGGNSGAPLNNDFVELHNSGPDAVDLSGWSVQYASSGGSTWSGTQLTVLSGTIPAGGYYLVQLAAGSGTPGSLPTPDAIGNTAMSSSAGKLALVSDATPLSGSCPLAEPTVVDFVGYGAAASCFEGSGPAAAPSNTTAVIRASDGNSCVDSQDNAADFAALAPLPRNSASPAQPCRGSGIPEPVEARVFEIQGSGAQSPMVGERVVTEGVVTLVTNNGFFLQDLTGDGLDATSDGVFVFTGGSSLAAVAVGHLVRVVATVVEFDTGALPSPATPTPTVTELSTVGSVDLLGTGYSLVPLVVALPEAVEGDLERVEGMLVTLTGPLTIQQNYFQGRYGQLTLAQGGRLETPTNRYRPGTPEAIALADENARRRILLDDGSSLQNPNPTPYLDLGTALPRAGDTVGSVTGVIDFGLATNNNPGLGDYKIHPTVVPVFGGGNPRTDAPAAVGGTVRVASFNVLNFFTTFRDGDTADGQTGQGCTQGETTSAGNCRGASNASEFERQRSKIVEAMAAIDADAFGLMEIQNNGAVAVQNLVDALNARVGAGTYASVSEPAQGSGTDAIRVAMIYKPARLAAVGAPASDTDPVNSRPTLAQTFEAAGERFTVTVSHLKSKGSCPAEGDPDAAGNTDAGDGQGCWNALRVQQAERLRAFVGTLQASAGSDKVLLIGDFNAYAQEDPMADLAAAGFRDTVGRFDGFGYSYVFDGAAGRLDQAVASAAMDAQVTGATAWHINADETLIQDYNQEFKAPNTNCGGPCPADPYRPDAYRASDHDPIVVGLNLFRVAASIADCRQGGWSQVYRADGSAFRGPVACFRYVISGS